MYQPCTTRGACVHPSSPSPQHSQSTVPTSRCSQSVTWNRWSHTHCALYVTFFPPSSLQPMKSPQRFRSSSRPSRRRSMTPADAGDLKRYSQRQLIERFRALGPMPTTATSRPMLTTAQMMKFNVFQDVKPKRRSNKKGRKTRS